LFALIDFLKLKELTGSRLSKVRHQGIVGEDIGQCCHTITFKMLVPLSAVKHPHTFQLHNNFNNLHHLVNTVIFVYGSLCVKIYLASLVEYEPENN
jgi:hypothetical protein